jgi:hypothetical protein
VSPSQRVQVESAHHLQLRRPPQRCNVNEALYRCVCSSDAEHTRGTWLVGQPAVGGLGDILLVQRGGRAHSPEDVREVM